MSRLLSRGGSSFPSASALYERREPRTRWYTVITTRKAATAPKNQAMRRSALLAFPLTGSQLVIQKIAADMAVTARMAMKWCLVIVIPCSWQIPDIGRPDKVPLPAGNATSRPMLSLPA